jgi:uncharacterized protein DUF4326
VTKVVNIKYDKDSTYCARGTIFGNPFLIGRDGNREEVIEKYKIWFNFLLKDERFVKELLKLKNKRIGCFCKEPDKEIACHLDILADWLNSLRD